jgi:hypothetical protein
LIGVEKYLDLTDHLLGQALSDSSKRSLRWRNQRSYMLSNQVHIEPQAQTNSSSATKYRMIMTGCLRGVPMYAHSLVHICGVGVGRITRIKQVHTRSSRNHHEGTASALELTEEELIVDSTK